MRISLKRKFISIHNSKRNYWKKYNKILNNKMKKNKKSNHNNNKVN